MERRPVRCAIYTRQSVARPNDTDFTSCEAQREARLEYVRAHEPEGWVPIDERFDDAGESGATTERPALARLLDRIASDGVDRVVVNCSGSRGIRNAGRVPLGYSSGPLSHQLVVQPEQAPVVRRMFEMAAAGAPPSAIAYGSTLKGRTTGAFWMDGSPGAPREFSAS